MKKTQFKDAIKNIRNRWASFLSVVLIVALGTGGFFTTRNVYKSFSDAVERVYDTGNFKNYDLVSSGGVVDADIEKIRSVKGVDKAEGVIILDAEMTKGNTFCNVKVISITDEVSVPIIIEGKMPAKNDEMLVNEDVAIQYGYKVGDTVNLRSTVNLEKDPLKHHAYTVSGIMRHPEYVRYTLVLAVALPEDSFNMDALNDSYTNAFVSGDEDALDRLYEMLPTLSSQTKSRLDETAEERINEKSEEINKQLKEAEDEINRQEKDAMDQLSDAEKKIRDFENLFKDGKRQIEEGKEQLASAYSQLVKGEKELEAGEAQLKKAKDSYKMIQDILKRIEKVTGEPVTIEKLNEYIDKLNEYIKKLKQDMIDGSEDMYISFETLMDYISNENVRKIIDEFTDYGDIIDSFLEPENMKELLKNLKEQIQQVMTDERFRDYFTYEGLDETIDEIETLTDLLAQALKDKSAEEIEKARQAISEFFNDDGSKVLDDLLQQYCGISLEELTAGIINSSETLNTIIDSLDEIITSLETEDIISLLEVKEDLKMLIELSRAYLESIEDEDPQYIADARKALLDFCETEDVQFIIELLNEATGEDLQTYINAIIQHDLPIDELNSFIDTIEDLLDNSSILNPEDDNINKDRIINALKDIRDKLESVADMTSSMDYETMKSTLDSLLSKDGLAFMRFVIKIKYNFDIFEIPDYPDKYIEVAYRRLKDYLEQLRNNEAVHEYYEKIIDTLYTIDDLADRIMENIDDLDTAAMADNIIMLVKELSRDDFALAKMLIKDYFGFDFNIGLADFITINDLENASTLLNGISDTLKDLAKLPDQIADAEKQLNKGRKQLKDGWQAYYDGLAELEEKEKLLNSSATEIANARKQLDDRKKEAETKLQEVRDELTDARKEAEEEIAKAREDILSRNYKWLLQDRSTNVSNIDVNGTLIGVKSASVAFGALFLLVISLVCFSTIAMIVEEEKRSVGTTKAFGFYNKEIFNKYLLFGVLASVIGCIMGIITSYLLTYVVLKNMSDQHMYSVGRLPVVSEPLTIALTSLFIIGLSVVTTFIACTDLLKSPAAILMKGETIASRDRKNRKKDTPKKSNRSLYSRLIIRNIVNEKERVLITVLIVALSCFIVGVSFTLRDSFFGMMVRQKTHVMIYDFRVEYNDEITAKELDTIRTILNDNNTDYLSAYYGGHLYDTGKTVNGLYMIVGDKNEIDDFVAIRTLHGDRKITLPDDGVLIQNRLSERYGLNESDTMTLYDDELNPHDAAVKGIFANYQGRYIIASNEAYEKIFGEKVENNCFYVKLNGADYDALHRQLSSISENISIERADSYQSRLNSSIGLYDTLVVIMTFMAILMSFMILTNLSNIFIARKKKELIIMRINGFSIRQTINYLAKETILTTLIGVAIAVLLGLLLATPLVRMFEHADTMFVRTFNVRAWLIAVVLECFFSFVINFFVFRKVKKLNFREI